LKKIKTAFATCPSRQSAKKFYYKKIRKAFADYRVAVGKRDVLRHLTTAYVPFADCHTGRWQRLCRLLSFWQVAKVSLPMISLSRVICRLPCVKQSAKPLLSVLGPLPIAFGSRQRREFQ